MSNILKKLLVVLIPLILSQKLFAVREGGGNVEELKRFTIAAKAGLDKVKSLHFDEYAKILERSMHKLSVSNSVEIVDSFTDAKGNPVPTGNKDAYSYPSRIQLLREVWMQRLSSEEEAKKHWVQIIHELFRVEDIDMDNQYGITIGKMQLNKLDLEVKHFDLTEDSWVLHEDKRLEAAQELQKELAESRRVKSEARALIEKLLDETISAENKEDVTKLARLIREVSKKHSVFLRMVYLEEPDFLDEETRTCNTLSVELAFNQQKKILKDVCTQLSPLGKCNVNTIYRTLSTGTGYKCVESVYFLPEKIAKDKELKAAFYKIANYLKKLFREEKYSEVESLLLEIGSLPKFL